MKNTTSFYSAIGLLLLAGIINTFSLATAAQSQNSLPSLKQLTLEQLMDVEVTSVSKKEQRVGDTAAAIFVITQEDIRRSAVTTIAEALRLAPGVTVSRIDGNSWAIGIRGFGNGLSRSVLVLIDGRSVYTPLFAGVFWEAQDVLLEDIDRIEVIRGPGGTIWGANAVNGVINIITRSATETQGLLVTAGGGSEEKGFGGLRYGGKIGQDFSYRVYGKGFRRDGQFTPHLSDADDWQQGQGGFRTDWNLHEGSSLTIQGDIYQGKAGMRDQVSSFSAPFSTNVEKDTDPHSERYIRFGPAALLRQNLSPRSEMARAAQYRRLRFSAPLQNNGASRTELGFGISLYQGRYGVRSHTGR
jgi:iron complex outermembrane recepter protein